MILCLNPGVAFADSIRIKEGTEVLLKLVTPLRSGKTKVGETVKFSVDEPVVDKTGTLLIQEGASAYGTITVSSSAGMFGQSGKLDFTADKVAGLNGVDIPLRTQQLKQEGSSNGAVAIAGFLFVSVLAGLIRGENAVVPAGTIFTVYVDKTTVLSEDATLSTEGSQIRLEGNSEVDQRLNDLFNQLQEKEENM